MLQVIHPLAFVSRPIHMNVDSLPVGLIVNPVALVDISVDMSELAEAMRPVVLPVTFVAGTVLPNLLAVAVSEPTDPLARVLRIGRVGVRRSLLALGVWVIRHV